MSSNLFAFIRQNFVEHAASEKMFTQVMSIFIVVRLEARRQGIVKGSSLFLLAADLAADKALVELSWFRSGAVYDMGLNLYTCVNA